MRTLILFLTWCISSVNSPSAAGTLSNEQFANCLSHGLTAVLLGRSVQQYIEFEAVAQRVVGPPYRGLSPAERSRTVDVLYRLLQNELQKNHRRFKNSHITVSYAKQSNRMAAAYGVEGTITSAGQPYKFAVNGFFHSASQCQLYGIGIEGVWSMVKFLQEHGSFQTFCRQELQNAC